MNYKKLAKLLLKGKNCNNCKYGHTNNKWKSECNDLWIQNRKEWISKPILKSDICKWWYKCG